MSHDNKTAPARESFIERQHRLISEAAVAEWNERSARHKAIAEILRVESYQVRAIIDLTPELTDEDDKRVVAQGAFVVQYQFTRGGDWHWTAVVGGKRDSTAFYTRAHATLHALALHDAGADPNDGRTAAFFAARTLGLPADSQD